VNVRNDSAAARRAAAYLALQSESSLAAHSSDPSALDAYCSLSARVDRACVSDTALAAGSAEGDATIAAVSRVLLQIRAILRDAKQATQAGASEAARAAEAEARLANFPDSSAVAGEVACFASLADALEVARSRGVFTVEVPRAFLNAIGTGESQAVRLLRAAFSNDDDALVRAMATEFDVSELRAAARLTVPRSMRKGLATAGDAFRGGEARERAIAWSNRIREIRRGGRKKRAALSAAAEATGEADEQLRAAAAAADAVWDSVDGVPPIAVRAALLCDALIRQAVDEALTVVPCGCRETDAAGVSLSFFDDDNAMAVDGKAFARALEIDAKPIETHWLAQTSLFDSAAEWLTRRWLERSAHTWPGAEPSEPVVASAMTFSASRLNLYSKCPRRWFYEYLCGAVEETTTSNAVYGKVFHAALEALHLEVRIPADWGRAAVFDRLCGLLDVAFGQAHHEFASQLEYEVLRLRARQVAKHYVRWLYDEAADAPLEIVEVESRQLLLAGGHRFVGYIDRIDRPRGGGPVTIFDYKTGRIESDPEEYVRQVRSGEEAQLALYYAMRRAQGDEVARIALVSIRDARDKTWILALDITDETGTSVVPRADRKGVVRASCSAEDLGRSLDILTERCDLLTQGGVDHFAVGEDPPCSYCAYALACRERPADGERIFAR
jgi:RecB family exonuclease